MHHYIHIIILLYTLNLITSNYIFKRFARMVTLHANRYFKDFSAMFSYININPQNCYEVYCLLERPEEVDGGASAAGDVDVTVFKRLITLG